MLLSVAITSVDLTASRWQDGCVISNEVELFSVSANGSGQWQRQIKHHLINCIAVRKSTQSDNTEFESTE